MIEFREEDAKEKFCPFKLNKDVNDDWKKCETSRCMAWYTTGLHENPVTKKKELWGRCAAIR